jgi:hypothetical protein
MRAIPTIASGTRHVVGVGLQALLIAAILGLAALAMSAVYKPAGLIAGLDTVQAGRSTVSISFASQPRTDASWPSAGSAVYFSVGTGSVRDRDIPKLWVANKCSQDGELIYAQYEAVHDGLAGPFGLAFDGSASCRAYVWMFPSSEAPLKSGSMEYVAH